MGDIHTIQRKKGMSIANIRLVYVELAQTHPNYGPYGMYEIRTSDKHVFPVVVLYIIFYNQLLKIEE